MRTFTRLCVVVAAFVATGVTGWAQSRKSGPFEVREQNGTLRITPLTDNSVRVQYIPDGVKLPELEELIYTEKVTGPEYTVTNRDNDFTLSTGKNGFQVKYSNRRRQLTFLDGKGTVILAEEPNSRTVITGKTGTLNSLAVRQAFQSPADEFIYGTGQFQDGYLNIRGLSRRLTQVNTQISIPMIISNKGYGLLWNNYGLTEFNPSDTWVMLEQGAADGTSITVNATGTLGNVRERRTFNDFNGTLDVREDGQYSILLDVGQDMARKHLLSIDGDTVINASNTWLPPTSSAIVTLKKGRHKVFVSGSRGDSPKVGIRKVNSQTVFESDVAVALDYTVFVGNADKIIDAYRCLTGRVPSMPEWAFGYIHCRERYDSQNELLENARQFRAEKIPVDVIVQDWQWWGKYGWNAMKFDETKYPDPKAMTDELHKMNMKLMLSVWSKIDKGSDVGKEMLAKGYYIDGTDWIDFFNPKAAGAYWDNFSSKLLPTGIDAWWQDATEPENDDLKGRMVAGGTIPGEFYRNAYPNMVNQTVYNGLRKDQPGRDPMILTRSGFTGIQRYGAINWSGDVGNDFDALKRQIAGGLNLMVTGQPWWTYDAGGFFRPGNQYSDKAYQERMLRWIQASVFLPFMRVHGYQSQTEPWRYPDDTKKIFVDQINLRYKIMPYILECAKKVSSQNYTMMRPLIFDFPNDTEALKQQTEYMFGPELLICPVTEPGIKEMRVYLPKSDKAWRDVHTGKTYSTKSAGQYVTVPVTLDYIPVFANSDRMYKMLTK